MKNQTPSPDFFSRQVGEARRFCLGLDPPDQLALNVVCAGLERCQPGYSIDRATFPYWGVEYVVRGRGRLGLGAVESDLKAGIVFSYGPGTPHHIATDPKDPLVKYFVDFVGASAPNLLRDCRLAQGSVVQVFPPDCMAPLFEELLEAGIHAGAHSRELCARLLECLTLKIGASSASPNEVKSGAFAAYLRCRGLIQREFLELRTLEQIADGCDMDQAYVCRLFRRFDHQTPYQYLLRLKINHAAVELQKPGVLVKQVAESVGFSDRFHFSRVFRAIMGLPPVEFRKLH